MHIGKLWQYRLRLLRWTLFLGALGAVGVGLYLALPPEPRWVLACSPQWVFDVGDGRFATYGSADEGETGPLQLWDVATGCEVARFLPGEELQARSRSDDGRYFVGIAKGDKPGVWRIVGVDLAEQREWHADVTAGPFASALFSPRSDLVTLSIKRDRNVGAANLIVETSSGHIVAQLPGDAEQIVFGADGNCVVAGYRAEDAPSQTRIADTRTGTITVIDEAGLIAVSPDSRWLIADRAEEGVWLWDIAGACWHAPLPALKSPPVPRAFDGFSDVYLAGGTSAVALRYYARTLYCGSNFHATRRGSRRVRILSSFALVDYLNQSGDGRVFSPDSRFLLCTACREGERPQWTLYDVETGKRLWKRASEQNPGDPLFTPDSRRIVVLLRNAAEVEVIDAATGATERTIRLVGLEGPSAALTRDGRALVITASLPELERHWMLAKITDWLDLREDAAPTLIRAIDLETGVTVGELPTAECGDRWLTDDRRFLVTVTSESEEGEGTTTVIRCWDMPPRKPLRWVVGAPVALGLAGLSLGFGWRRLRRARAAAKPRPEAPASCPP
jgi:hypothetical protein